MPLSKKICQKCLNEHDKKWGGWDTEDELYWESGEANCPEQFVHDSSDPWIRIDAPPPKWCPWIVEHLLIMQGEEYED